MGAVKRDDLEGNRLTLKELSDKELLGELYVSYVDLLRSVARKILFDTDLVNECISEVFLLAIKKIDEVRNHPNKGGWLICSLKYIAMKINRVYYRINKNETSYEDNIEISNSSCYEDSVFYAHGDIAYINYDKAVDKIILTGLTEIERVLYNLYYRKSMPLKEIAEIMGIGLSAVKMRKFRLVKKLKMQISELCESEEYLEAMMEK